MYWKLLSVIARRCFHEIKHRLDSQRSRLELLRWGGAVGSGLSVSGKIRCHNLGELVVGDRVRLNSGPDRNYVGGDRRVSLWVSKGARLVIEDRVGISGTTIVARQSVIVREGTLIGGGCDIYDNDFHPLLAVERRNRTGTVAMAPVEIGPWAFIGAHTIVLKGVKIGAGAVVGAGSVVARDVPDNEIWAGKPARFVRNLRAEKKF